MSKEVVKVEYGVRQNTKEEIVSRNPTIWVEEVLEIMRSRDLKLCNRIRIELIIIKYIIIMDYTKNYVKVSKLSREVFD